MNYNSEQINDKKSQADITIQKFIDNELLPNRNKQIIIRQKSYKRYYAILFGNLENIRWVKERSEATIIKVADLIHYVHEGRIKFITENDFILVDPYRNTYFDFLELYRLDGLQNITDEMALKKDVADETLYAIIEGKKVKWLFDLKEASFIEGKKWVEYFKYLHENNPEEISKIDLIYPAMEKLKKNMN